MKPIQQSRKEMYNTLERIERSSQAPKADNDTRHERITQINSDIITEAYYSTPLTNYIVDFKDDVALDTELEFFAPTVEVMPRFEYATHDSAEAFLSDGDDDERSPKADFKEIEETEYKVNSATVNRGLQITLDFDKIRGRSDWEEHYSLKLMRRLKRNSLRRAIAMLSAAAVNTNKTWDATAGKDPDQDVLLELILAANLSGIKPCRVAYGDTAFAKRLLSHRAQITAGGFSSGGLLSPEELTGFLGVDSILRSKARYTASASAKAEILGNLVLMFNATSGVDTEDASNIKRFISMGAPEEGGGQYQVYSQRVSAKRHILAVGQYEKLAITSTLGIRKFTIA
jgi:hypothetical protein